jgi:HK97 family phage portal protein
MGIFPFKVYKSGKDGKVLQADHPCQKFMQRDPNPYMTAFDFKFMMMSNQLLYGAGIAEIEFDKRGLPISLHPIYPSNVTPVNLDGKLTGYKVVRDKGSPVILQPHQLLIFRLFPKTDGGWYSPVQVHRETFGSALAVRDYGAAVFGSGINPAGIITGTRGDLDEASQKSLVDRFKNYVGLGKSHSLMILQDSERFERVGVPPQEAQYLETRRFDISEIARIYNVPLHLLAEMEKATSWGTGLAEMNQLFIEHVMMKHVKRWEEEINKKLISVDDDSLYGKFVMDGLLRGNTKERMESYKTGAGLGLYSINEIRAMEERNPLDGDLGDARLVPLNYQNLEKAVHGNGKDKGK